MVAEGIVRGQDVRVLKPTTYMNRSGAALVPLRSESFDPSAQLLVLVDDAALDVGRVRFRPRGSAGGHNGLKSIEAVLGTQEYARIRIGVGIRPSGVDLADWVLERMPAADEEAVVGLLPHVARAVEGWLEDPSDTGMSRFNR
jgi:peptidyl-tRNA hydrolase, PTH1 family